jgi:excisionase family DNA binding protein
MVTRGDQGPEPEYLTVRETAALLRAHPNTVRRWAQQGVLQAWRIGPRKDRRFLRVDVLRLLTQEIVPDEQP